MTELEDFSIESTEETRRQRPPYWPFLVGAAIVLVAVVAYFWWRQSGEAPPEAVEEAGAELPLAKPEEEAAPEPPQVDLPSLAESDEWVRLVIGQLSAHPELARWLVTEDLIQRFVVVVDNVAEGTSPRTHLPFLEPEEGFQVRHTGGRNYVDASSYDRYENLAAAMDTLDVRGAAELYRAVKPLIQEAYRDLGYPNRDFDQTLLRAIDRLLRTPVIEDEIELIPGVSSYKFADPKLEELSDCEKHFLRLGPDNLRTVQNVARQIALEAGLPQSARPSA